MVSVLPAMSTGAAAEAAYADKTSSHSVAVRSATLEHSSPPAVHLGPQLKAEPPMLLITEKHVLSLVKNPFAAVASESPASQPPVTCAAASCTTAATASAARANARTAIAACTP